MISYFACLQHFGSTVSKNLSYSVEKSLASSKTLQVNESNLVFCHWDYKLEFNQINRHFVPSLEYVSLFPPPLVFNQNLSILIITNTYIQTFSSAHILSITPKKTLFMTLFMQDLTKGITILIQASISKSLYPHYLGQYQAYSSYIIFNRFWPARKENARILADAAQAEKNAVGHLIK